MSTLVREALKNYYYNDIDTKLDLDYAIKKLSKENELDDIDIKIIELVKLQYTSDEISKRIKGLNRFAVYKRLNHIYYVIAKLLGINYQDFKIILQVERRLGRKLTDDERKVCWYIIKHRRISVYTGLSIYNYKITRDGKILAGDYYDKSDSARRLSQQI